MRSGFSKSFSSGSLGPSNCWGLGPHHLAKVRYVEIDRHAAEVLEARMRDGCLPVAPIVADARTFAGMDLQVDGIVAGFPCVDICGAGRRRGLSGPQSGLVSHVFRLLGSLIEGYATWEASCVAGHSLALCTRYCCGAERAH